MFFPPRRKEEFQAMYVLQEYCPISPNQRHESIMAVSNTETSVLKVLRIQQLKEQPKYRHGRRNLRSLFYLAMLTTEAAVGQFSCKYCNSQIKTGMIQLIKNDDITRPKLFIC